MNETQIGTLVMVATFIGIAIAIFILEKIRVSRDQNKRDQEMHDIRKVTGGF